MLKEECMKKYVKPKLDAVKLQYKKDPIFRRFSNTVGIFAFALVGVWLAGYSMASTPSNLVSQSDSKDNCGKRVANYNYQVPFGNASWNTPVCGLKRSDRSSEYASRMFNFGVINDGTAETANNKGKFTVGFGLEPLEKNWTRAVYYASDATTTRKVQTCANNCGMSNFDGAKKSRLGTKAFLPDLEFPWNPSWEVASAGDNAILIIDEDNGRIFSFSAVKTGPAATAQCFPWDQKRLCASSADILRDYNGNIADYRTYEGSDGSRGAGINNYATLLTPQEIQAGEIRHALGMGIFNTSFGPACTTEQLAQNDPKVIDVACGTAVAPAGKFEWAGVKTIGERVPSHKGKTIDSVMTIDKTVPEGVRFALDIDDAYIENWINSRDDLKSNPRKAETVRIIARALRDYGWMPVDTGGQGANIQTAGGISQKNRQLWSDLGITDKSDDKLLYGLFTETNIYALEPPINNCIDGTQSKYYCPYTSSTYADSPAQENNTTPNSGNDSNPDNTTNQIPDNDHLVPVPKTPLPIEDDSIPNEAPTDPVIVPTSIVLPNTMAVQIGWNPSMFEFHQSAKLRWGSSTSPHSIAKYVVKKNGKVIYEGSRQNYTDFAIDTGQKYRYEFSAIDGKGNVSQTSTYEKTLDCGWLGWSCRFK